MGHYASEMDPNWMKETDSAATRRSGRAAAKQLPRLLPEMRAFYTWFHSKGSTSGVLIEYEREAFLAGWAAAHDPQYFSGQA